MALSPTAAAAADRLLNKYNADRYNPSTNPGGMGRGGHRVNLIPAFQDLSTVANEIGGEAQSAANYAAISQQARTEAVQARDDVYRALGQIGPVMPSIIDQVPYAPIVDYMFTAQGGFVGSVTRNSPGSFFGPDGLLQWKSNHGTRLTYDPYTSKPLGVYVEGIGTTNLLYHSEDLTQSVWIKGVTNVTSNIGRAPDGTNTADEIDGPVYQTVTFGALGTAAGLRTFSSFVEAGSASTIDIVLEYIGDPSSALNFSGTVTLNVVTGQVSAVGGSGIGAPTPRLWRLGGGRYRIGITLEGGYQNNAARCTIRPNNGTGRAWGLMLEPGPNMSSYVASTTVNGTRATETFSLPINVSGYSPVEGTVYAEFIHAGKASNNSNTALLSIDSGLVGNGVALRLNSNSIQFGVNDTGYFGSRARKDDDINRVMAAWGSGLDGIAVNGADVESSNTSSPTSSPTRLILGGGNGVAGNGIYGRVILWPRRVTDATLKSISGISTTPLGG